MGKFAITLAALLFSTALVSQCALAQSGSIGCGTGSGANIACNTGGQGGTVTMATDGTVSSTGISTQLTAVSGLPSGIEDLSLQSETLDFSFSNVGFTLTSGGTFTLTDGTDGDFTVSGLAEFGSTPTLSGALTLVFEPTFVSIGGSDDGGVLFSGTVSGLTGGITLNLDPGNVTSVTGTFGLPTPTGTGGGSTTPEPGTLLLFSSGLLGFVPFVRRKLA